MRTFRLLLWLVLLTSASCSHHSVHSHGVMPTSTNGVTYFCDVVEVDTSVAPIVVLARYGGQGRDYSLECKMSHDRYYVDGVRLAPVTKPTICFMEQGKLKTRVIAQSGVWLSLFKKDGPTADELRGVFEQLEQE